MDEKPAADTKGCGGPIPPAAPAAVADNKHGINPRGQRQHGNRDEAGNKCMWIHLYFQINEQK
jgi:hypothetical protein